MILGILIGIVGTLIVIGLSPAALRWAKRRWFDEE